MKRFRFISMFIVLAGSVFVLNSCDFSAGNEFPDNQAELRIVNYHDFFQQVTIRGNGRVLGNPLFDTVLDHQAIETGSIYFRIDGTADTLQFPNTFYFADYDVKFTLFILGTANRTVFRFLEQNPHANPDNRTRMRFLHAAVGKPAVDIYVIPNPSGASAPTADQMNEANPAFSGVPYNNEYIFRTVNNREEFISGHIPYSLFTLSEQNSLIVITALNSKTPLVSLNASLAGGVNYTGVVYNDPDDPDGNDIKVRILRDN